MAKKLGPGRCVHCGRDVEKRTWDHVFPKGWYPTNTPANIEKWKIPACRSCNAEYGQIEEELGIVIPLCLGRDAPNAAGMYQKALRAVDPSRGKNYKDKLRREAKRQKLLRNAVKGDEIPDQGHYPGLEERWGRPKDEQVGFRISADALRRLVEKIVKGITYIESGRYLDARAEIDHHVVTQEGAEPLEQLLTAHGEKHSREPGIEVLRAVTPEDGVSALYKIVIWGQFVLYASVLVDAAQQSAPGDTAQTPHP